jgi:hypothetical protein
MKIVEGIYYDLKPGVYELDVEGYFKAEDTSQYNLAINFSGINRLKNSALNNDNNSLEIINTFNTADKYYLSGTITGYEKKHITKLRGNEHFKLPFTFKPDESSKSFTIELSKTDYNKVTDFTILILDESGMAVINKALSNKQRTVSIKNIWNSESSEYTLELIPAFTHETGNIAIDITEKTYFAYPTDFAVTYSGKEYVTMYPGIPVELNCELNETSFVIPESANVVGKIYFVSAASKTTDYKMPVIIDND